MAKQYDTVQHTSVHITRTQATKIPKSRMVETGGTEMKAVQKDWSGIIATVDTENGSLGGMTWMEARLQWQK